GVETTHADLLRAPAVELEHEREVVLLVVGEGVLATGELLNLGPARHGRKRRAFGLRRSSPRARSRTGLTRKALGQVEEVDAARADVILGPDDRDLPAPHPVFEHAAAVPEVID